jgi:carbonic anhydrase/acetyltransferase-like protein (isoleucine patch superfamily)
MATNTEIHLRGNCHVKTEQQIGDKTVCVGNAEKSEHPVRPQNGEATEENVKRVRGGGE